MGRVSGNVSTTGHREFEEDRFCKKLTYDRVALKKIAQPHEVASAMAFLASHRAAGHISGECLSVDGGMEGRIIWKENEIISAEKPNLVEKAVPLPILLSSTPSIRKKKVKIGLSVDFDAISGWLGTGANPGNMSVRMHSPGYKVFLTFSHM